MPLKTKLEVLSKEDIARVHDASLKILKESGVVFKCREALSMDVIQDVAHSGEYLTHDNTFQHFRDRWSPTVSVWDSLDEWKKNGSEDILVRANRKFKTILENCPATMIDPALDRELKAYVNRALQK